MKTKSTQQEIMLLTGSSFAQKEWIEKNPETNKNLSKTDKLEDACWNGLLGDSLPELSVSQTDGKKMYLNQVLRGKKFLLLAFSADGEPTDHTLSIDPYAFYASLCLN